MDLVSACVLGAGLFAATAGLFHAAEKRTNVIRLKTDVRARIALRYVSCAVLAFLLGYAVIVAGWEIAIPAWLGLLGVAGTASLFLAARSRRWHLVAGLCTGLAGTVGLVADAFVRLSGFA